MAANSTRRHPNGSKRGLDLNALKFSLSSRRPRLLEHDLVQQINRKMKEYDGKAYGQDDVCKMMIAESNTKVIKQGKVPLTPIEPSCMSVCNYTAAIMCKGGLSSGSNKAILKTNTRFTTDNSLIAAMNFAVVLVYSYYIPVSSPCKKVERDMEKADIGVRILVEMVS